MLAAAVGHRYERPVGDKVNNFGLMTTSGSYDFKLIENVTNMQDALLERAAVERFGELDLVPYRTPHEAALTCSWADSSRAWPPRDASSSSRRTSRRVRASGSRLSSVTRAAASSRICPAVDLRSRLRAQDEDDLAAGRVWDRRRDDVPQRGRSRARQPPCAGDGAGRGRDPRRCLPLAEVAEREGALLPRHAAIGRRAGTRRRALVGTRGRVSGVRARNASRADQLRNRAAARDPPLGQPELVRAGAGHAAVPPRHARADGQPSDATITRARIADSHAASTTTRARTASEGTAALPFRIGDSTYQLPVTFYFFTPPRACRDGRPTRLARRRTSSPTDTP